MRTKLLVFSLISLFCCEPAHACTCIEVTDFGRADKVFTGKILAVEKVFLKQTRDYGDSIYHYDYQMNKFTTSVVETFKGQKTEKEVFIYSGGEANDCGYHFSVGKTYIIFATANSGFAIDNLPGGQYVYFTNDCSDTVPYTKELAEFLRN